MFPIENTCQEKDLALFCLIAKPSLPANRRMCPSALDKNNTSRYDVYRKRGYTMDIQLKRGLLDVCVLAAIKSEDSYGYKIIKDLKPSIELSESTLYTILKRLEYGDDIFRRGVCLNIMYGI